MQADARIKRLSSLSTTLLAPIYHRGRLPVRGVVNKGVQGAVRKKTVKSVENSIWRGGGLKSSRRGRRGVRGLWRSCKGGLKQGRGALRRFESCRLGGQCRRRRGWREQRQDLAWMGWEGQSWIWWRILPLLLFCLLLLILLLQTAPGARRLLGLMQSEAPERCHHLPGMQHGCRKTMLTATPLRLGHTIEKHQQTPQRMKHRHHQKQCRPKPIWTGTRFTRRWRRRQRWRAGGLSSLSSSTGWLHENHQCCQEEPTRSRAPLSSPGICTRILNPS